MVRIFSLEYANAKEMQKIVGDLFDSLLDPRQVIYARARGLPMRASEQAPTHGQLR
jgi:hypothetical protein